MCSAYHPYALLSDETLLIHFEEDLTMARFRAEIRGQRGEASRLGSAKTGIVREVNGLDLGIEVQGGTTTVCNMNWR